MQAFVTINNKVSYNPKFKHQPKFNVELTGSDYYDIGHPIFNACQSEKCKSAPSDHIPACYCSSNQLKKSIAVAQHYINTGLTPKSEGLEAIAWLTSKLK